MFRINYYICAIIMVLSCSTFSQNVTSQERATILQNVSNLIKQAQNNIENSNYFEAEEKLRKWQAAGNHSLIIVRPTVIFGEGNRGNVFNLLNQIASGKFLMIGIGENKKSMAYIGNIVAFLETCVATQQKYGVYNYVDTPDLTMNELVSQVRAKLKGKNGSCSAGSYSSISINRRA